jgi:AAA domain
MSLPQVGINLDGIQLPTGSQQATTPPVGSSGAHPVEIREGIDMGVFVKAFVYGDAGSGKTVFGASAPDPLFLDTEGSTEVLRDWPQLAANCKVAHITWDNFGIAIDRLKTGYKPWSDRQTVILDTADALQRRNLSDHVMAQEQNTDKFLPMQHHYKKSGEMLVRALLDLKELPMHVLVLSHHEEQNQEGKPFLIRPAVSPKVYKAIRQEFSMFGFMWQSQTDMDKPFENRLQTRGDRRLMGKSRYARLPPVLVNPTFNDILYSAHAFREQQPV